MECSCAYGGSCTPRGGEGAAIERGGARHAGAFRVGDIGVVATIAAEMAAVMLVVLVLLLTEGGIG